MRTQPADASANSDICRNFRLCLLDCSLFFTIRTKLLKISENFLSYTFHTVSQDNSRSLVDLNGLHCLMMDACSICEESSK